MNHAPFLTNRSTEDVDLINSELSAKLTGKYLFENPQFLENIIKDSDQTTAQKIVSKIKEVIDDLVIHFKGTEQEKQLREIQKNFKEMYKQYSTETSTNTGEKVQYALEKTSDGTEYVSAETDIFIKKDGTLATEREVFKALEGKVIHLEDGDVKIVNRLPKMEMYNELFRRRPNKFNGVENAKQLNTDVNYNMEELLDNSKVKEANVPDYKNRHQEQGINSFDTRIVKFYDGKKAYDVEFSIGNLDNGDKVAYAKKYFGYDEALTKKIQQSETTSEKSRLDQNVVSDTILSQTDEMSTEKSLSNGKDIAPEGNRLQDMRVKRES